jgi:hypothetical protein
LRSERRRRRRGYRGVLCRFHDECEWFVLLIVIVVEIPKRFLGLPPFHDTTETSNGQKDLNVPVTPMPIRMFVPRLADILDPLYECFTNLGLSGKLGYGHVNYICGNADDIVERSHNRIDRVIDENSGRSMIRGGRVWWGAAVISVGEAIMIGGWR